MVKIFLVAKGTLEISDYKDILALFALHLNVTELFEAVKSWTLIIGGAPKMEPQWAVSPGVSHVPPG